MLNVFGNPVNSEIDQLIRKSSVIQFSKKGCLGVRNGRFRILESEMVVSESESAVSECETAGSKNLGVLQKPIAESNR